MDLMVSRQGTKAGGISYSPKPGISDGSFICSKPRHRIADLAPQASTIGINLMETIQSLKRTYSRVSVCNEVLSEDNLFYVVLSVSRFCIIQRDEHLGTLYEFWKYCKLYVHIHDNHGKR